MKLLCLLVITALSNGTCFAQSGVDQQVENRRKELFLAGIDTTACYYKYFNNGSPKLVIPGDTTCHPVEVKYLFWSERGESFVQRFDECKRYIPRKIPLTFIKQLRTGITKLSQEKILNSEYATSVNGIIYRESVSPPSHGMVVVFEIFAGKTRIEKSFMDSAFGGKYVYAHTGQKYNNINYHQNLNTIQYKLKILAEAAVEMVDHKS